MLELMSSFITCIIGGSRYYKPLIKKSNKPAVVTSPQNIISFCKLFFLAILKAVLNLVFADLNTLPDIICNLRIHLKVLYTKIEVIPDGISALIQLK